MNTSVRQNDLGEIDEKTLVGSICSGYILGLQDVQGRYLDAKTYKGIHRRGPSESIFSITHYITPISRGFTGLAIEPARQIPITEDQRSLLDRKARPEANDPQLQAAITTLGANTVEPEGSLPEENSFLGGGVPAEMAAKKKNPLFFRESDFCLLDIALPDAYNTSIL